MDDPKVFIGCMVVAGIILVVALVIAAWVIDERNRKNIFKR